MNRLPIFTETSDGKLTAMRPSAPVNEDSLQKLIADFPEIISVDNEPLLLISREQSIPDMIDGSSRFSLDNLFVTKNAIPVLVEVKRATDTRIRREVVGQLLDYAANGVVYWKPGTFEKEFETQCRNEGTDPALKLSAFLEDNDEIDFWEQVDANLQAGRIKLIIAADKIPKELARIVEFLNEQMTCTVLAVELTYFESEDGRRTLAPKIIGETERTDILKSTRSRNKLPPISIEEWKTKHLLDLGNDIVEASNIYLKLTEELGAKTTVASTQGSLVAVFATDDGTKIYPLFIRTNGRVEIGFSWINKRPALIDDTIRINLLEAIDAAVNGLSTDNINGIPSFPVERLNNPEIFEGFKSEITKLIQLAVKS